MKKITLLFALLLASLVGNAQSFQWAKQISGISSFNVNIKDLTYRNGEVYVCGSFSGTVDFDPSTTVNNKIANGTDGFVARFDADGDLVWVTTSNVVGDEEYLKVRMGTDADSFVDNFLSVLTKNSATNFNIKTFDTNIGSILSQTPNVTTAGTLTPNDFTSLNENYIVVGSFTSPLSVNGNQVSFSTAGAFVLRFGISNTGVFNYTGFNVFDDNGISFYDVTYTRNSKLFIGGSFTGAFTSNYTNNITFGYTSQGSNDGVLLRLNTTSLKPDVSDDVNVFGGIGSDAIIKVESTDNISTNNYLYIGGFYSDTVDFDTSTSISNEISLGATDAFISAYNISNSSLVYLFSNSFGGGSNDTISSLSKGSYLDKVAYTIQRSNTFGGNFIEMGGLTSSGSALAFGGTLTATAATTLFRANGVFYLDNGFGDDVYTVGTFTGTSDLNPDSAVTNNLTYVNGGSGTSNSFIQKLGDCSTATSAQTLSIQGANSICIGNNTTLSVIGNMNNSAKWVWYSSSCGGILIGEGSSISVAPSVTTTYYVRGEGGCVANGNCSTSTVTVKPLPNTNLTQTGATLSVSQASATYQWINCTTNTNIVGANSQSFTPTAVGNYKVEVTLNGCVDISSCFTFLSTDDFSKLNIKLYPNPVKNSFTIEGETTIEKLKIYNLLGQQVKTFTNTNTFNIEDLNTGTYLVEITTEKGTAHTKIVKE